MSAVKHAVIAAAGLGSRLGLGKPKCLLEVGGYPLIHHQLQLLEDVSDVRVVIGFDEQAVMEAVIPVRSDVIFVRNPAYRSTTTLTSYGLAAAHIRENCLFLDADILFEPASFRSFLDACAFEELLIAVTEAKTADAVFAHRQGRHVARFSRAEPERWEWANLCWLPPGYCETGRGAVFERLTDDLPLALHEVISFEIDTPGDYEAAIANLETLNLRTC